MDSDHVERYLAFDLGATSGRGIVGTLAGGQLQIEEVARFETGGTPTPTHLYWDILHFFAECKAALRRVVQAGVELTSVGFDTWGVDYGLLDARGNLWGNPVHYRDPRTAGEMDRFFARVPRDRVFEITGIQNLHINTLFQLSAHLRETPALRQQEFTFLHVPDLLNYLFTGQRYNEYTIASTSQLLDVRERQWAPELLSALGLSLNHFPPLVAPGTRIGPVLPQVAQEVGLPDVGLEVVAPASHDTASAVAAVPADDAIPWAYLSSGTWSLMGVELPEPCVVRAALEGNFTNEGGVDGRIRFLKNIQGLWLLQQCKDAWFAEDPSLDHEDVARMAREAPPHGSFVFPDDQSFVLPDDMIAAIQAYCQRTGQPVPRGIGPVARCVMDSLACRYREVLDALERITGTRYELIHVVGGGSKDATLCQFTANATNRKVVAGPAEATAIGNVLVQAMAVGTIPNLAALRAVVRRSFPLETYEPQDVDAWTHGYAAYQEATGNLRESF